MASETSCDLSPQRMHAQVLPDEVRCYAGRGKGEHLRRRIDSECGGVRG